MLLCHFKVNRLIKSNLKERILFTDNRGIVVDILILRKVGSNL